MISRKKKGINSFFRLEFANGYINKASKCVLLNVTIVGVTSEHAFIRTISILKNNNNVCVTF